MLFLEQLRLIYTTVFTELLVLKKKSRFCYFHLKASQYLLKSQLNTTLGAS